MSSPITQFNEFASQSEFLFVVVYRGHWCPFCQSYLRTLSSLSPAIIAAGGLPLTITSEVSSFAPEMAKLTGYTGNAVSDPSNEIVEDFKSKGLVDVAITEKKGYEHGMAQPAVLVLKKDGTVLYSWAIVPALMNLGGAKDRPSLEQIWENVQAQLQGKEIVHKSYRLQSALSVLWGKLFG